MLLFILLGNHQKQNFRYFNTSHVTVYQRLFRRPVASATNFNTSHVTVYLKLNLSILKEFLFQYISCYCLSSSVVLFILFQQDFNTSHVTVYHFS